MEMKYTVQPGDTFYFIAQRYGISLDELISANPQIQNPDLIYSGQMITIPAHCQPRPYDKYRSAEPYPEIRVMAQNPYYAQLLLDDYAGKVSETTAIMQYVHHHLQMEQLPAWQETAKLEEGISIIEMTHLEMLGQTILLLGGNSRYCDGQQCPWTPEYIEYFDFDPCAQLRADIRSEQEAIQQYLVHLQVIQDPYIQALLTRIIKDEEYHIQLFTQQLSYLCPR